MSVVLTVRATINCDALGCRAVFQGSDGCYYVVEGRSEARAAGWRVNVPRERGPYNVNPLPFVGARLDFCPAHQGSVQ